MGGMPIFAPLRPSQLDVQIVWSPRVRFCMGHLSIFVKYQIWPATACWAAALRQGVPRDELRSYIAFLRNIRIIFLNLPFSPLGLLPGQGLAPDSLKGPFQKVLKSMGLLISFESLLQNHWKGCQKIAPSILNFYFAQAGGAKWASIFCAKAYHSEIVGISNLVFCMGGTSLFAPWGSSYLIP